MNIEVVSFEQLDNETLYQILKLRVDVFVVEQNCPYPELDNKDQNAKHFFIKEGNEIVAYLRTYFKNENVLTIGRIITHIKHRGGGLSRQLINKAIETADKTTKSLFLQGQTHLQSFYESFGFEKISDSYLEDGIPHIDMELLLNNC
ncbi:MAG: GNAT family N-acetyltransferase [Reichenbachiella sp.]